MQSPIPIESRALGTLAYIRRSIDSSGSMAVPGMAGIVMGVIGVIATILASVPKGVAHWLQIWLVAAIVALAVGGATMARQAAADGHARYLGPVRKFVLCLCPALFAGAVLTAVLWRADATQLIPGVWLLLYGCAVLSASTVRPTHDAAHQHHGRAFHGAGFASVCFAAADAHCDIGSWLWRVA